eukprot:m.22009 g.22009  ORF g.22009 m.22009 type:complete len:101 (-) comp8345_c0_seq1:194-496(-)
MGTGKGHVVEWQLACHEGDVLHHAMVHVKVVLTMPCVVLRKYTTSHKPGRVQMAQTATITNEQNTKVPLQRTKVERNGGGDEGAHAAMHAMHAWAGGRCL